MIKTTLFAVCSLSVAFSQDAPSQHDWAEMITERGISAAVTSLENQPSAWPRLGFESRARAIAEEIHGALLNDWKKPAPSKRKAISYAKLSRIVLEADGWGNRILADTSARFAIDYIIRVELAESNTGVLIDAMKELPPRFLPDSMTIAELLSGDTQSERVVLPGKPLDELGLKTTDALWVLEANTPLTARQLLQSDNKACFVARLAQTEILVQCYLPLMRDYIQMGGTLSQLGAADAAAYHKLMVHERSYSCVWMSNRPVSLQNLVSILTPYRHSGRANPILREFLK